MEQTRTPAPAVFPAIDSAPAPTIPVPPARSDRSLEPRDDLVDWHSFWLEGLRYLEIVRRAWPAKPAFTPEILYHMTGMAIEKLFMAWLGTRGHLPENHTVRDLARAAETLETLPPDLYRALRRFDRFMGLCSLEPVPIPPPAAADVPEFIATAEQTLAWLQQRYSGA